MPLTNDGSAGRHASPGGGPLLCSLLAGVRAPDGGPAAAPLEEQLVVQADVVGVQAGAAQEFEEVAGTEGAAEGLPVDAGTAPALGIRG